MERHLSNIIVVILVCISLSLSAAEDASDAPAFDEKKAIYYPFRPAVLVNVYGSSRVNYMYIKFDLVTYDYAIIDSVKKHLPVLHNNLIEAYNRLMPNEFMAEDRQEIIVAKTKDNLNTTLKDLTGEGGIEAVMISELIFE